VTGIRRSVPVADFWGWSWIGGKLPEPERKALNADLAGKFLWFSPYRDVLLCVGVSEVLCGFRSAKVSLEPRNGEYVLCVYDLTPERKSEVEERTEDDYSEHEFLHFAGWKYNWKTRRDHHITEAVPNPQGWFPAAWLKKSSDTV
jgi:hypothetical protein